MRFVLLLFDPTLCYLFFICATNPLPIFLSNAFNLNNHYVAVVSSSNVCLSLASIYANPGFTRFLLVLTVRMSWSDLELSLLRDLVKVKLNKLKSLSIEHCVPGTPNTTFAISHTCGSSNRLAAQYCIVLNGASASILF